MKEFAEAKLSELIFSARDAGRWKDSRFGGFVLVPATTRNDIAKALAVAMFSEIGYPALQNEDRHGEWGIRVGETELQLRVASEDIQGKFQIDGVRPDRQYDLLLAIGIAVNDGILFRFFKRSELSDQPMVPMAEGAATRKLPLAREELFAVDRFPAAARRFVGAPPEKSA